MSGAALMVCGTSSDAGKSLFVTALCRLFARRGLAVAPFKGQNMSLNSTVTEDGGEVATAQALQAFAAGVPVERAMNPVLLKPFGEGSSQLVVLGRAAARLNAKDYQQMKTGLRPVVLGALAELRRRFDVVVAEGAGAAAEPNFIEDDLVNLGLADAAGLPAVVVGDIDRGGVFAALVGTTALLPPRQRRRLAGYVINKFRGDPDLLGPAISAVAERCGLPCLGVVPHLGEIGLAAEDSLGLRDALGGLPPPPGGDELDVAVVRLPHLANFSDFDPLALEPGVRVRFVSSAGLLGDPDLVVLPGSKATVADLAWLRAAGFPEAIASARTRAASVLGVCAGYQMMGVSIVDGVESPVAHAAGLGLIDAVTTFLPDKITRRRSGRWGDIGVTGYEIHHGVPEPSGGRAWFVLGDEGEGVACADAGVWATSLHGLFESDAARRAFLGAVAARRGKQFVATGVCFDVARRSAVEALANAVERAVSIEALLELAEAAG